MVIKTPQKRMPKKIPAKPVATQKKPAVVKTSTPPVSTGDVEKNLNLHTKHLEQIDDTLTALKNELRDIKNAIVAVNTSLPVVKQSTDTKNVPNVSWHALIDPDRKYTQKEIIGITKISQPTLSMAKVRGHIITREQPGKRGWVVLGSDLLTWDNARAKNAPKKQKKANTNVSAKKPITPKPVKKTSVAKPAPKAIVVQESVKTGKSVVALKKETNVQTAQAQTKKQKPTVTAKKTVKTPPVSKTTKTVNVKSATKTNTEIHAPIPSDIPDRISALTVKKVVTQTQFGHDVGLPQKIIYEITTKKRKELDPLTIQKITTVLKKYESK